MIGNFKYLVMSYLYKLQLVLSLILNILIYRSKYRIHMKSNTITHPTSQIQIILNSRKIKDNRMQYLVKWKSQKQPTWESIVTLSKNMKYVFDYQKSKKSKIQISELVQNQHEEYEMNEIRLQYMQIWKKQKQRAEKIDKQKKSTKHSQKQIQMGEQQIKKKLRQPDLQIIDSEQFQFYRKKSKKQFQPKITKRKQPQIQYIQYVGIKNKQYLYNIKYTNLLLENQKSTYLRANHPMELITYLESKLQT